MSNPSPRQRPERLRKLVDSLSPVRTFGNAWPVWLDASRYADTNGFSIDGGPSPCCGATGYQRFQYNMPYDSSSASKLAGDPHADRTDAQLIATGSSATT